VTAYLIHTHPFNSPFSGTNGWAGTRKDFNEARDSEWQWHQLGHMQVCTALKTDNHASTSQAGCPFFRPTNSVKALKAQLLSYKCTKTTTKTLDTADSRNNNGVQVKTMFQLTMG